MCFSFFFQKSSFALAKSKKKRRHFSFLSLFCLAFSFSLFSSRHLPSTRIVLLARDTRDLFLVISGLKKQGKERKRPALFRQVFFFEVVSQSFFFQKSRKKNERRKRTRGEAAPFRRSPRPPQRHHLDLLALRPPPGQARVHIRLQGVARPVPQSPKKQKIICNEKKTSVFFSCSVFFLQFSFFTHEAPSPSRPHRR